MRSGGEPSRLVMRREVGFRSGRRGWCGAQTMAADSMLAVSVEQAFGTATSFQEAVSRRHRCGHPHRLPARLGPGGRNTALWGPAESSGGRGGGSSARRARSGLPPHA